MPFLRLQPHQHRNSLWWLVLAFALVLAPALGRMHQVLHAPAVLGKALAHGVTAASFADAAAAVLHPVVQAKNHPHGLFASHTEADCELLDQQILGGVLPSAEYAAPLAHALAHALPACRTQVRARARRLWACLARAPPAQA